MDRRFLLQVLASAALAAVGLAPGTARATDPFTRDTFAPYTLNDANALIGNHAFVQSLLAFDRAPFTVGLSTFEARADWLRADDSVFRGGLERTKFLVSVGGGRPATGFAAYGVLNADGVAAKSWPSFPFVGAQVESAVAVSSFGLVAAGGVAYKGWVAQLAYHFHRTEMDTDLQGRFTLCDEDLGCYGPSDLRPGAPVPLGSSDNLVKTGNTLVTLENAHGYSVGAVLAGTDDRDATPQKEGGLTLASLRALAQPEDLLPAAAGVLGLGLTTYAAGLDYYGDHTDDAPGEVPDRGILEFPFSMERIAGTGATARIVLQATPVPAFRLAEVGYGYEGDPTWRLLPQAGGRAKLFLRDQRFVPSVDAFVGAFWVFRKGNEASRGHGLSAYATYAYNSPDAANMVPIPGAHVAGMQVVFGNPTAMPPPSSLVKYPTEAE